MLLRAFFRTAPATGAHSSALNCRHHYASTSTCTRQIETAAVSKTFAVQIVRLRQTFAFDSPAACFAFFLLRGEGIDAEHESLDLEGARVPSELQRDMWREELQAGQQDSGGGIAEDKDEWYAPTRALRHVRTELGCAATTREKDPMQVQMELAISRY
eukprot:2283699-Rhodomonas_salina.3